MQKIYKIFSLLFCCCFMAVSVSLFAQEAYDDCANALDISEFFMGSCGQVSLIGPLDNTGATRGATDPPEPGESPTCPQTTDTNLFGDEAEEYENSIWVKFTIPDLNGDGSPVAYSIWTSDGSFGDDCGINPNNLLGLANAPDVADTQVAVYESDTCPDNTLGECDYYAANEDLFTSPPWISGWLALEFTPGNTYYMAIDSWDGFKDQGEFCLTVVLCGVEEGDGQCAPVETYCESEDCRDECPYGNIAAVRYDEADDGFFFSADFSGNIFFCSEFVNGYSSPNTYLGFGSTNFTDCNGENNGVNVTLSNGSFVGIDPEADGSFIIPSGSLLYIELTDADISAGAITITSSVPDGLGNMCGETVTLNYGEFPQANDPYCTLSCFAGGIQESLLTDGIVACEDGMISLCTNGLEDLSLPCEGGEYDYYWRAYVNPYGDWVNVTGWVSLDDGSACPTVSASEFLIDRDGSLPPLFSPGTPIAADPYGTGEALSIIIESAALCVDAEGTTLDGCLGTNGPEFFTDINGTDRTVISLSYYAAGNENCVIGDVMGCTDMAACNYNAAATIDDGSCAEEDCAGECGGSATPGSTCDDGNADTENDVYQADCSCAGTTISPDEDSDECDTAVNISSAFSEECEMAGPYEQGGATTNPTDPVVPGDCYDSMMDGTTWYSFVVPDYIAGGSATDYIISTGNFEDCTSNPLEGNGDTQIAIYEGSSGCPSGGDVPIACNDDISDDIRASSVQVALTPGTQYYIMVETFGGNLSGEFCFYVQPLADFLGGGTKDCTNCNDGICNVVTGESFINCPTDCPCDANIRSNSIDENGIPGQSMNYIAYCPETVGGSGDGLYIPFNINSTNVPMGGPGNVTFLNSTLTTTVGAIYTYNFGGAPSPQPGDATQNVTLIYLTPADITAVQGGTQIELTFTDESGGCIVTASVDVTLNPGDCGPAPIEGCTDATACNYDSMATIDDGSCTTEDCTGACGGSAGPGTDCTDANGNASTYADDCSCPAVEILGCTDTNACNYNEDANTDDGSCTYPDPNFDCQGNCLIAVDCAGNCGGDAAEDCNGVCEGPDVAGADCTDADGNAGKLDGGCNCVADDISGCTDMNACNFNAAATVDDGSCIVVAPGTITLADGSSATSICVNDGIEEPVDIAVVDAGSGPNGAWVITDLSANILALPAGPPFVLDDAGVGECLIWWLTFDDGLTGAEVGANAADLVGCFQLSNSLTVVREECTIDVPGCTDSNACNYDSAATVDDGSCTTEDCAGVCGGTAVAGTACTTADGAAGTYATDCSCTPNVGPDVFGCTDSGACNYDPAANMDDGSCTVIDCAGECGGTATPGSACTDSNGNTSAYEADCSCPDVMTGGDIPGCTDATACNYNPAANVDDGSCVTNDCAGVCGGSAVVGSACDDGDANTTNDSYNASCECVGLEPTAPCMSQAGTVTLVDGGDYGGMNYVCAGNCATVSAGDFLLEAGQGVKIVWHTDGEINAGNIPPSNVLGTGSFYCNEAGIKQTVYATAFGGQKYDNDEIDYSDYCLTISNTIAINFLAPITISVDTQCDGSNGNFTYTFSVDGGLPECTPGETYAVTGDFFSGEVAPGETQSVGPVPDGSSYNITVTDANGCSATYNDEVTCTKLPITLEIFVGEAVNQGNQIKWVTGTEINNDYFSLQASDNGADFKTIATIDGQGNSNTPVAYEYLDRAAAKGTTYYRLVQTDFDGTQSKSKVIDVTRGEAAFNITDLYPIPTSDVITLQYVAPGQSDINIEVFDLIGQTLISYQRTSDGGVTQMDINVEELPAGVYFISIISNNDKVTQKFVIE